MSVDRDQLCGYLDSQNLTYAVGSSDTLLIMPNGVFNLQISVVDDGGGVLFRCPNVFNLGNCQRLEPTLKWICHHTYETKVGHFGVNWETGDVDVSYHLVVMDGELGKQQFLATLSMLTDVFTTELDALRNLAFEEDESTDSDGSDWDVNDEDDDEEEDDDDDEDDGDGDVEAQLSDYDGALPTAPVDESEWLGAVVEALTKLATYPEIEKHPKRHAHLRALTLDELDRIRQESIAAGRKYASAEIAQAGGLTPDATGEPLSGDLERCLWYMTMRRSLDDERVIAAELAAFVDDADEAIRRLTKTGCITASDDDGQWPWRLTEEYVKALGLDSKD